MSTFDCVWCWIGGTQRGHWFLIWPCGDSDDLIQRLGQQGYVGIKGKESIGPPDEPPSQEDLDKVVKWGVTP